jgi:D-3-phosphoglycerate dehydrogenase / 2-oxoglutarate reductase
MNQDSSAEPATQKVLIIYAGHKEVSDERAILDAYGAQVIAAIGPDTDEAMANYGDCDALMVTIQPVTAEMMDRMPKCKIICRIGTGLDAIDIPAATERGIWVTSVPDYSIDEVSSHAMAFVLALARNLFRHRKMSQTGTWRYQTERPIARIVGQTMGVVGIGRIGSASVKKATGLGFNVIAFDPYVAKERFAEVGARKVDFDTLLAESDFITLHVPLTPETRKLIDAAALAKMKPTAFVINTARGEVVDIDALVDAVQRKVIAGAGIDVLPIEPPPADYPILHEESILVTPHIGWASTESGHDVRERGAEDVVRVLRSMAPKYPANQIDRVVAAAD